MNSAKFEVIDTKNSEKEQEKQKQDKDKADAEAQKLAAKRLTAAKVREEAIARK